MGTRNLTLVQSNNSLKVAQYGQWDGYPSGNGVIILEFVRSLIAGNLVTAFRDKVNALTEWTEADQDEALKSVGITDGWATFEQSAALKAKYPGIHRDTGASILSMILEGTVSQVSLNTDFASDSLFCEWAYLINLDANTLEVYEGFNKEPLDADQRFAYLTEKREADSEYHPIKKVKEFTFDALPTNEDFLKILEPEEATA